ncbi:hypothetical protein GCM10009780_53870 [Actinomadura alba]
MSPRGWEPGDGLEGVHYLRTLEDALTLRKRLTSQAGDKDVELTIGLLK